jgi:hypothetical protein
MAILFVEAIRCLLDGQPLGWVAFEDHKAGSLTLAKPDLRNEFLLKDLYVCLIVLHALGRRVFSCQ